MAAVGVSSILLANFIEIASISKSGFNFLICASINVESTPPLSAIQIFLGLHILSFDDISLDIIFSIFSRFGDSLFVSKSFHDFFGRFGVRVGS